MLTSWNSNDEWGVLLLRYLFHPIGLPQGHHPWFGQGCPDVHG